MLKQLSHLPVIVDPSHGTGKWELVEPVSRAAVAAGADGLIIEVHPRPEEAVSDGAQSLKPNRFASLMKNLAPIAEAMGRTLMTDLSDCRITIVGLGLMGASLAGALRGRCRSITGVARRPETIESALAAKLIDRGTNDLAEGVRDADMVILGTPVRVILETLPKLGPLLPPGCLLLDMGSTKAEIVQAMDDLPEHVQALGGHPMCGKEISGLEAADPGLYQGCTFILCPLPRTSPEAMALAQELIDAIGAHPLVLDAERQDYLVGTLSHLPYLLACTLVKTADTTTSADPAAWNIVAGGFRDTSRVASSDVTMMTDILLTNKDHVIRALAAFKEQLEILTELVASEDEVAMRCDPELRPRETDRDVPMSVRDQILIRPVRRLSGRVQVPGDKSISHRALLLGALADGASCVENFLPSGDCLATLNCLRSLGVRVDSRSASSLTVHGRGFYGLRTPDRPLDCERSGTTMRLLAGHAGGPGVLQYAHR